MVKMLIKSITYTSRNASSVLVAALLLASTSFNVAAQATRAENTVSVSLPPNSGMVDPNPANNTATDSDTVELIADLTLTKANPPGDLVAGTYTTYTLVVTNLGPSAANGARLSDNWNALPGLDCSAGPVTCTASGAAGTMCPAPATLTPDALLAPGVAIPMLPNGGVVTVTLRCLVTN